MCNNRNNTAQKISRHAQNMKEIEKATQKSNDHKGKRQSIKAK